MMSGPNDTDNTASSLAPLDRIAIAYLTLPLAVFIAGWLEPWAALPLLACLAYALRPLWGGVRFARDEAATGSAGAPLTRLSPARCALAIGVGLVWTLWGGSAHLVFANPDWVLRDAVLHDLVAGAWPVGYGPLDGHATLLRAPLGYYLPAALVGKLTGLRAAHAALALWTALGVSLFLMQVLSLTPPRRGAALLGVAVIVLFSGLDIIGNIASVPHFAAHWTLGQHLEWWARRYQYSSMTTQLFWVPNHALGGWLAIGLLERARWVHARAAINVLWPMLIVAVSLWSPLTALGLVPFILWRMRGRACTRVLLHPRSWAPALLVGVVLASYLTLDAARIPRGFTFGQHGFGLAALAADAARQLEFFLLEAGLIGGAVLWLRRSSELVLALVILALLPLVSFGPANDLVMRASIPSLVVLALAACLALVGDGTTASRGVPRGRRVVLGVLLALGALTPLEELARAVILPAWPPRLDATVVEAACGRYPAHYIARLGAQVAVHLLRSPQALLPDASLAADDCVGPAWRLMRERGLW